MAKFVTYDEGLQKVWTDWVATRPTSVQEKTTQYPPDELYLLKTTGRLVFIISYDEDRNADGELLNICTTCTVAVSSQFNTNVIFDRQVFNIKFEDLEPAPLPEWVEVQHQTVEKARAEGTLDE